MYIGLVRDSLREKEVQATSLQTHNPSTLNPQPSETLGEMQKQDVEARYLHGANIQRQHTV